MKKVWFVFLAILFFANNTFAASTPEETVSEMIKGMQADGSPSGIIEYVHWQTAFGKLSDQEKKAMGVNSPEELKSFYQELYKDPSAYMQKQMRAQIDSMPKERQAAMEAQMGQLTAQVKQKFEAAKVDMKNTKFEIVGSKVNGNEATVNISSTLNGKKEDDVINLVKVDDKWYLPSMFQGKKAPAQQ